jgi:hypothetical protein
MPAYVLPGAFSDLNMIPFSLKSVQFYQKKFAQEQAQASRIWMAAKIFCSIKLRGLPAPSVFPRQFGIMHRLLACCESC